MSKLKLEIEPKVLKRLQADYPECDMTVEITGVNFGGVEGRIVLVQRNATKTKITLPVSHVDPCDMEPK